jgi:hypothetical protein
MKSVLCEIPVPESEEQLVRKCAVDRAVTSTRGSMCSDIQPRRTNTKTAGMYRPAVDRELGRRAAFRCIVLVHIACNAFLSKKSLKMVQLGK